MLNKLNAAQSLRESDPAKLLSDLEKQFKRKPTHFARSSIAAFKKKLAQKPAPKEGQWAQPVKPAPSSGQKK
jgi:hypothetical protein